MRSITVKTQNREFIGDAVVRTLVELKTKSNVDYLAKVVAVIPRMLTYFANSPERYEVTEVELIIE